MDRVKFNDYSEILSDDLNNTGEFLEDALNFLISDFFSDTPVVKGLKVVAQATPDLTVQVQSGRLYQSGQQGVLESASSAIAVTAPNAQYNRIDRICAKYIEAEDTSEIRNVMVDVSARTVDRQTVYTRIHGTVSFQVVPGVASADPVPATVPDGWVSLAQVTVRANASFISDTDILDERSLIQDLPGFMNLLNSHKAAATLDHPDGSVTDAKIGTRTITDSTALAGTAAQLTVLLGRVGNMLKTITGKSNWYTAPAMSLQDIASVTSGKGAALVGIADTAGHFTSSTVEGALTELGDLLTLQTQTINATSGTAFSVPFTFVVKSATSYLVDLWAISEATPWCYYYKTGIINYTKYYPVSINGLTTTWVNQGYQNNNRAIADFAITPSVSIDNQIVFTISGTPNFTVSAGITIKIKLREI